MKRRTLAIVIVGALLLGAGGIYWATRSNNTAATNLLTATVKRGNIEQTVLATGIFKPSRLVAVGAQVSGRITAVHVKIGDTIKKNDLVAEIDSVTQQNNLRTSKAALANVKAQKAEAQATLVNARLTLERQQSLLANNSGKQADVDSAQAALDQTKAQIDALDAQIIEAEVAVETAQANLGYTRITAPMDGTVLAIVNQQGQTVNATQSAPTIVILGQLDKMIVRAEISEADVVRVKPGQPVYFNILGDPSRRFNAVLQSIEPAPASITSDSSVTSSSSTTSSASTSAIYYNGVFPVDNTDGYFRTYMTAEVHIVLGQAKDVLVISSSALPNATKTGKVTLRVANAADEISTKTVEIGLNDGTNAEIKSGLSEGDRVVIGDSSTATDGSGRRGGRSPMRL
ncbi:efflux RND transporter periplasmic adaptor subunit [Allorhizobium terrae]|uniref:Efflux RND transporter periplasmic adaptor subunit n=1 Tax=Allorhizobium terrae TaxID=1848972 RepID=A0A4S3ZPX9_9HYPH|nr:efflux RND transporter periplasmic adaptor subunit [Allorhizobium terrae]THF47583.1 efflux RND transporter periplasmic adaptor subunit [Allorhizobium terrae]